LADGDEEDDHGTTARTVGGSTFTRRPSVHEHQARLVDRGVLCDGDRLAQSARAGRAHRRAAGGVGVMAVGVAITS
jgi:hypothetical protein